MYLGEFFVARLLSLLNSIINFPQDEHFNPCTYWYIISDDDLESTGLFKT